MAQPLAHPAPYTVYDLPNMPDDGNRYEVFDGQLIVSPSPEGLHQRISRHIANMLAAAAPPELDVIEGIAVRCGEDGRGPVPDVVVTSVDAADAGWLLQASNVLAVVEVVSPGSRLADRLSKPEMYAAAGIPTYWRIETTPFRGQLPTDRLPLAMIFESIEGSPYELTGRHSAGAKAQVTAPFPVTFDPQAWIRK